MNQARDPNLSFLTGGGEMGARIRDYDWSSTSVGCIDLWPSCLRTALSLVLNSKFPNSLCWGPDFITFHNDAFEPLLGGRLALGQPQAQVWAEIWSTVKPIAEAAYAGDASYFEDLPFEFERDGRRERTYYTFSYSPVRDENGGIFGILTTVVETTGKVQAIAEQRQKEEELRQLNMRLTDEAAAYAADRDRVWRISQDVMAVASLGTGKFLTVNPAFTEIFGWSSDDAVSVPFMDLVYPEDRDDVAANMLVLATGTPLVRYNTRVLHKDGSHRWVCWTIVPEGELLYGVARDITAEIDQANALRLAEEALRHSQKMEAVGQLTGGLAHDFNNMLAGVSGHLDLMKLRLKMGQGGDLIQRIDAALGITQRAAALTHRLLAFSRRQALDPKATRANELIASMTELIGHSAGPAICVKTSLQPGLWTTLCDPNQLENALLNLANNARDAMPDGGTLTIETRNAVVDDAEASQYGYVKAGDYVVIAVSDSGVGMEADVVSRAFDPFFTTKPLGQGTGLGLSMVYGFAKQSGGHTRISSVPGLGTQVLLRLPRYETCELAVPTMDPGSVEVEEAPGSIVVLVVEDEPYVREVMGEALKLHGYTVIDTPDAASALRQLETQRLPDILVTDIGLPGGMNGRQLADLVRLRLPDMPVLLVTGYAGATVMKNESLPARMELLTKPFTLTALVAKVAEMVR